MLLSALSPRQLGVSDDQAPLHFDRPDASSPFARHLYLSDKPAFELSLWCGTCPFLFERKEGANATLSADVDAMADLEGAVESVDDRVLAPFSTLLPEGEYLPLLVEVQPEMVAPYDEQDYFSHEQVATWGPDSFWGLPENPHCVYYRTFETQVTAGQHLYEFIVPMVPPGWNDRARVQHYRDLMDQDVTPTAVALSTLDVCQPATDGDSTDYYVHWGLTHFLLDGHHKVEAAARSGASVRLLALVSVDGSLAGPHDIARLGDLLRQPRASRAQRGVGRSTS